MTPLRSNPLSLLLLLSTTLFFSSYAFSQKNALSGTVTDTLEKKKLQYAIAALINQKDSTLYKAIRSDEEGRFYFSGIPTGHYTLMISYPHMADYLKIVDVTDTSHIKLGVLPMILEAALLQEVIVRSSLPIRMRGDTLEYTADSFAVKPGDNVEALLKRLPGIVVEKNGRILAQGQEVKRVLVDGDEFFADDPKLAAKYLAAGAVDKVQVYDGKSEKADFTGIDDGKRTKTINLKLKADKRNGHFGKLSAGGDAKENYNADAMGAIFRKDMKASVFGLASRTGKEGLGYNELSQYVAQDYERIDDGAGNVYYTSDGSYENENYYGSGIPSVLSGGAHFSNKWKNKSEKLFSNYRIKRINASGWDSSRSYTVMPDSTSFYNTSQTNESTYSFMQKASASFTLPLDSINNSLVISVNGNKGENSSDNNSQSASRNQKGVEVNKSLSRTQQSRKGGDFESNLTFRHRFKKEGRTIVLSVQQQYNENNSNDLNYSRNNYFDATTGLASDSALLNQLQQTRNTTQSLAAKGNYAHKISDQWNFSIDYGFKSTNANNRIGTFNNKDNVYSAKVDSLSMDYTFLATTHITGTSVSWHKKKLSFTLGSNFFLTGFKQTDKDLKETTRRNFVNFAPRLIANIRLKNNQSLSMNYSGETQQPGVNQLQPLRRSSNPLYVNIGNPDLKPEFRHNISTNFYSYSMKGQNFYGYANLSFTNNAITTTSTTDANGRSVAQYINIDGNLSYNGQLSYDWEYKKLHLRPGIQASVYSYTYNTILNKVRNKNNSTNYQLSPRLTYNLNNKLDLTYSGSLNYAVGYTSFNSATNRTWRHEHNIAATGYLPWKLNVATDCNLSFQPKNQSFNSAVNVITWNASLQKKLLKGDKGEISLSVRDLLNRNTGYSRNVYGNNTSESNRLVLKRYFMLTFTWNFTSMF